ncbi:MAG: hypothetical protein P4L84_09575 [Isosphaeraceae bacterium]|nr:hypothetical protein [Isosphaeraceae bacterium]
MSSRRRQKDERKQERALREQRLQGLRSQVEPAPLAGDELFGTPPGMEKMSEALEAFIEPYVGMVTSDDDLRKLVSVAVIGWNAALLGPDRYQAVVESHLATLVPDVAEHERDLLRGFIESLIERKNTLFADNRRFIASFELANQGGRPILSVSSTPGAAPVL